MKVIYAGFVPGTPVPQGSLRSNGRGGLFYSNAAQLKPYRTKIADCIRAALGPNHASIDAPIHVAMTFYFAPLQKPKVHKLSAPDLDKLSRSILDAVTESGLYVDDSRVVGLSASKLYHDSLGVPGVYLTVSEINDDVPSPASANVSGLSQASR